MTKVVLNSALSTYDVGIINANFAKIQTQFQDKVLYRDNPVGEPNTLETDVNANNKRIYNLPEPTTSGEPLRLEDLENVAGDLQDAIDAAEDAQASAVAAANSAASASSSASNAAASAVAADASELDAENAASSAAGSADTATQQAVLSTAYSNVAGGYAASASASAFDADASANGANASAIAAGNSATAAAASAVSAAASAASAAGAVSGHISNPTGAHAATAISNTPAGSIAATTVQAAINELDTEKLSTTATTLPASFTASSLTSVGTLTALSATGQISTTAGLSSTRSIAYSGVLSSSNAGIFFDGNASGTSSNILTPLNLVRINSDTVSVGVGGIVDAFHVYHNFGGAGCVGGRSGTQTTLVLTAATDSTTAGEKQYVVDLQIGVAQAPDGGTGTTSTLARGALYGSNPNVRLAAAATNWYGLFGTEVNVAAQTGSSVAHKCGVVVVATSSDNVQGIETDSAIVIANQSGAVGWRKGLSFNRADGVWPMDIAGTLIGTNDQLYDTLVPMETANGVDFSDVTFSGSAFKSNGFNVNGSGGVTSTSLTISGTITAGTLHAPTTNFVSIGNTSNGTSFKVSDGGTAVSNLWVAYGAASGSRPTLRATSTTAVSANIQNGAAAPIILSTNGDGTAAEQLRINHTAGTTNYITITGSNGANPTLSTNAGDLTIGTGLIGAAYAEMTSYFKAYKNTAIPAGGTSGSGYRLFSATNFGMFGGSGAPTLSAAKGSVYLRSDGSTTNDRMYVNTDGGTTWTAVITST